MVSAGWMSLAAAGLFLVGIGPDAGGSNEAGGSTGPHGERTDGPAVPDNPTSIEGTAGGAAGKRRDERRCGERPRVRRVPLATARHAGVQAGYVA